MIFASPRICALALLVLPLLPAQTRAQGQPAGRALGIAAGAAISGSPMGQVAERNATPAIPGGEVELRVLTRSATASEWSLGILSDDYRLEQNIEQPSHYRFEYSSTALVVGYGQTEPRGEVPIHYAVDLGWRRFSARSSGPNHYTGEAEASRTRGDAALLGVSYGIEIPIGRAWLVPRVRIETNYPDFGGGEGYSALHRTNGPGFRASVGVGVKRVFSGGGR